MFVLSLTLVSVTVVYVLNDLKHEFPDIQFREALITLNRLKCYCKEHVIARPWNAGCLKDFQDIVKDYIKKVVTLEKLKIGFGGFEPNDIYPNLVDSVHCITGKFVQMCSSFLVEFLSNSLLQMNFGSI